MQIFGEARIREIIRMKVLYTQNCFDAEGTTCKVLTPSFHQLQQMEQEMGQIFVSLNEALEKN